MSNTRRVSIVVKGDSELRMTHILDSGESSDHFDLDSRVGLGALITIDPRRPNLLRASEYLSANLSPTHIRETLRDMGQGVMLQIEGDSNIVIPYTNMDTGVGLPFGTLVVDKRTYRVVGDSDKFEFGRLRKVDTLTAKEALTYEDEELSRRYGPGPIS